MSAFIPCKLRGVFVPAVFTVCLLVVQGVSAQNPSTGTEHIRVVGHLPLDNTHADRMFVEQRDQEVYLYLHRPTERTYAMPLSMSQNPNTRH